jgi:hypothetical protein
VPRPVPARPPGDPGVSLEEVNAAVASLAALTGLVEVHVRGYGNPNYNGLRACLLALTQLRALKLQHAEPGLSGLQGLFIENPVAFGLDCLGGLLQLTRLEVQVRGPPPLLARWPCCQGQPRRLRAAAGPGLQCAALSCAGRVGWLAGWLQAPGRLVGARGPDRRCLRCCRRPRR